MKRFEDLDITEDGRVFFEGNEIRQALNTKRGYYFIVHNGKMFSVHRLVANAFVLNSESKPQVNHIDGDKRNNHYSNLEWCTHSENQKHAYDIGTKDVAKIQGEKNGRAKLNKYQVKRIRLMKEVTPGLSGYEIARMFGVSNVMIYDILNRNNWKHV